MEAWLPIGLKLPDGAAAKVVVHAGEDWQIVEARGGGRILIVERALEERWIAVGLIPLGLFSRFEFGGRPLSEMSSGRDQVLSPLAESAAPQSKQDAISFAAAFKATRDLVRASPLHDAIFVEKISRLLPTYSLSAAVDPEAVVGSWLTGGIHVPASAFRRLHQAMGWLAPADLKDVVEACGFDVDAEVPSSKRSRKAKSVTRADDGADQVKASFTLPGRPELAAFFNEHIVDIIRNRDRYQALGIGFPAAVILHGPPGCGKTFAVDRLIDFLGWPSFQIDASSVASPYIHETSKKVAEVFEKAMASAPSVLVIDEMEAFLADRETGSGHHRVEEVAEFLRRIPEATENDVLIVAMTNRIEMIDPAILRRGRFDHVIEVGFAGEKEIQGLLGALLDKVPCADDIDPLPLAKALAGRPLSDVSFIVREGARLAARSGADQLRQVNLMDALRSTPARSGNEERPRIGF
jgi:cell division protease FtsH